MAAARKAYEWAREVFEQLSAAHPDVPGYQHDLASAYGNLGRLRYVTGRPAAARKNGRLSQPSREKLAEQNAVRAVELLKQAHAAGYFKDAANAELLKTNKDLDPLRARADFSQLAATIGKATKK
jgi:hypothetical protein